MAETYWPWRVLRWKDCNGALVGLERLSKTEVRVLVGSGVHQGKTQVWSAAEPRVYGVPDWVWQRVPLGKAVAGEILDRGFAIGTTEQRERLSAVERGETVLAAEGDAPLVFTTNGTGAATLAEPERGRCGSTAATVMRWGWACFPLPPGSKIPFGGSHGYKDAKWSHDVDRVWAHWRLWPDDNLALATGQENSPVVVDIDPRNGGSIEQAEELFGVPLRHTLIATTPSGGWHLYFTDPLQADSTQRLLSVNSGGFPQAPGIEIKATMRHVVMPPSLYGEGEYAFIESVLEKGVAVLPEEIRLKARTASKRIDVIQRKPGEEFDFFVPEEMIWEAVRNSATNGRGRNNTVHEAAKIIVTQTVGGDELRDALHMLRSVAAETELPEHEVDKAIRSAVSTWQDNPKTWRILESVLT